jgi:hypothetical protein
MRQHYVSSALTVQRSTWVPPDGPHDYLRYYDTFANGSGADLDVTVTYAGELGAGVDAAVAATSDGDGSVETSDTWYATHDPVGFHVPTGHVWHDAVAVEPTVLALEDGYLPQTTFELTVPALTRVALMVFVVQMDAEELAAETCAWLAGAPVESLDGLTQMQLGQVVNWRIGGAPLIRLVSEETAVEEGGTLELSVSVVDVEGDAHEIAWDLDGDTLYDDASTETVTFDAGGLDGPGTAQAAVRATDAGGLERVLAVPIDVLNADPRFLSRPAGLSDGVVTVWRGSRWEYAIEVDDPANAGGVELDPVEVSAVEKPAGCHLFADLHLVWEVPTDGSVLGDHLVHLGAEDHDGGVAEQQFTLHVPDNSRPPAPTIVSPDESVVNRRRPELVVLNTSDPEDDPLVYEFQVATSTSFERASLLAAGNRLEDPSGQTSWTVTVDLLDGGRYYWRVWADDGHGDGPAAATFFDVDLDAVEDDAATDIRSDVTFPGPPTGGACGCRIAGAGADAAPFVFSILSLVLCAGGLVIHRGGTRRQER